MDEAQRRRAFGELYDSTFDQILAHCRRHCLGPDDAEDAVVEVYLTAWRKLEEALEADPPRSWLYGVAFRVTANQRRGRDRFKRLVGRLAEIPHRSVEDSAEDMAMTAASADAVYAALETLAPIDQELIKLAALDGFSHQEIAAIVDRSVPAVRTRLFRARQRLAARLELNARRDISSKPDISLGRESMHRPASPGTGQTDEEEQ
ncbi:MAG: RNA polymerase sigma factor [Acidimicrobiia bacterium]